MKNLKYKLFLHNLGVQKALSMGIRRGYLEQFYPCKGSLAPKSLTTPALPEDWELFPDGLSLGKAKMSLVDNKNVFFEKTVKMLNF